MKLLLTWWLVRFYEDAFKAGRMSHAVRVRRHVPKHVRRHVPKHVPEHCVCTVPTCKVTRARSTPPISMWTVCIHADAFYICPSMFQPVYVYTIMSIYLYVYINMFLHVYIYLNIYVYFFCCEITLLCIVNKCVCDFLSNKEICLQLCFFIDIFILNII